LLAYFSAAPVLAHRKHDFAIVVEVRNIFFTSQGRV
jgi:hypothetical protein